MAMKEWEIRRTAIGQNCMNIILCDDDPEFLKILRREILRVFAKMNVASDISEFNSPRDIPQERAAMCDMVFLDIDFDKEDCNGIDIARTFRQVNSHGMVFFVTNYIEYAPAGFEVQAFRYVLKRDVEQVLERYILQAMENLADSLRALRIWDREQVIDLPLEQIDYLEVMDHSVSIHAAQQCHTLTATLSSLEREMEELGFLRIHKSYLVNMQRIRKFRSRECLLQDGTVLNVSEKNYAQQKQKYLLWKGLK